MIRFLRYKWKHVSNFVRKKHRLQKFVILDSGVNQVSIGSKVPIVYICIQSAYPEDIKKLV